MRFRVDWARRVKHCSGPPSKSLRPSLSYARLFLHQAHVLLRTAIKTSPRALCDPICCEKARLDCAAVRRKPAITFTHSDRRESRQGGSSHETQSRTLYTRGVDRRVLALSTRGTIRSFDTCPSG